VIESPLEALNEALHRKKSDSVRLVAPLFQAMNSAVDSSVVGGTQCNAGAGSVNPALAKVLKSRCKIPHVKVDDQLPHAAANPSDKFTFPICGRMTNEQ